MAAVSLPPNTSLFTQPTSNSMGPSNNNPPNWMNPLNMFQPTKGALIRVESRTWPGINKPGGIGKVTKVHMDQYADENSDADDSEDSEEEGRRYKWDKTQRGVVTHVDVKYVLSGSEKRVDMEYVHSHTFDTDNTKDLDKTDEGAVDRGGGRSSRRRRSTTTNPVTPIAKGAKGANGKSSKKEESKGTDSESPSIVPLCGVKRSWGIDSSLTELSTSTSASTVSSGQSSTTPVKVASQRKDSSLKKPKLTKTKPQQPKEIKTITKSKKADKANVIPAVTPGSSCKKQKSCKANNGISSNNRLSTSPSHYLPNSNTSNNQKHAPHSPMAKNTSSSLVSMEIPASTNKVLEENNKNKITDSSKESISRKSFSTTTEGSTHRRNKQPKQHTRKASTSNQKSTKKSNNSNKKDKSKKSATSSSLKKAPPLPQTKTSTTFSQSTVSTSSSSATVAHTPPPPPSNTDITTTKPILKGVFQDMRTQATSFVKDIVGKQQTNSSNTKIGLCDGSPASTASSTLELEMEQERELRFTSLLNGTMRRRMIEQIQVDELIIEINKFIMSSGGGGGGDSSSSNNDKPFGKLEVQSFLRKLEEVNKVMVTWDTGTLYVI